MKKLRRVTESEVVAEFLKNEFYQEEFHHDRYQFESLVLQADISDENANAVRRALLFRRRGHMWREIPSDTAWWEVEIEPEDLARVRVFPRAQWRKVANGSFLLSDVAERIGNQRFHGKTRDFVTRVQALSYRLRTSPEESAVVLIGIDDSLPVTILEGNHRLTAALLASPEILRTRFRVFCGLSPHMDESCWYQTNFSNLWRYAKNRARNLFYDRDADVERVMTPVNDATAIVVAEATVTAQNSAANSK
jgi:hypothetical protein